MAELLRPANAGSNTAADHVGVLETGLAQLPARGARPTQGRIPVLVRSGAAGATHEFAAHLAPAEAQFSLGANLGHFEVQAALAPLPGRA